ncbi:MAG: 3-oxoacyl-ACP synthase III [Planctomycetota bacterium]|nr:MAG: 3-oxoacyl-ACP synthase III [Planctomycetota bacterium]
MRYSRVVLEAFGYVLPEEIVTSDELEQRLAPAYQRLRLPGGRLELMTGIRQRRFFPRGAMPGRISIESGRRALAAAGIDPRHVGALVHGSVCRDYLEPATACSVHHALGLPGECLVFDASNACLGILTGMLHVANMIELGQIRAGLVVGTEDGRALVEKTIERLNADASIDRRQIKQFVASLTIGSASVAVLLCDAELSRTGGRLLGGTVLANSAEHELCQSEGLEVFMRTDSEQLMLAGVETAAAAFERFLREVNWTRADIDATVCHQVGAAHRKLLFDKLGLSESLDYSTFEVLGNTGAAALPVTMALAAENGRFPPGCRIAMLGIGSGINCQMLGVEWGGR